MLMRKEKRQKNNKKYFNQRTGQQREDHFEGGIRILAQQRQCDVFRDTKAECIYVHMYMESIGQYVMPFWGLREVIIIACTVNAL